MSQVLWSSTRQNNLGLNIADFRHRQYGLRAVSAMTSATPQDAPTVFVVDNDVSVRESLELLISLAGWRAETFASAHEFLARPRVPGPSCLVLDVSLPDLNGLEVQTRMAVDRVEMPIIFITAYADIPMAVRAMKAGALDFMTKPFDDEALLRAVRQAIKRSQITLGQEAEIEALRTYYTSLTSREREVMALVVSGRLNKQVGLKLGISEITVKAHRGKVMQKMNVDSFADLVKKAERLSALGRMRTGVSEHAFNF
jgi:FixJ family two-component response regulator